MNMARRLVSTMQPFPNVGNAERSLRRTILSTDIEELEHDILVLIGHLYLEDLESMAPETREVVEKWVPIWEKWVEEGAQ